MWKGFPDKRCFPDKLSKAQIGQFLLVKKEVVECKEKEYVRRKIPIIGSECKEKEYVNKK